MYQIMKHGLIVGSIEGRKGKLVCTLCKEKKAINLPLPLFIEDLETKGYAVIEG